MISAAVQARNDPRPMTSGFLLGKFMPLHRGHMYLIDRARDTVNQLTVLVCSRLCEPIPGDLRFQWVRDLYPDLNVQHCADEIPSYPHEHPDFWNIWQRTIRRYVPSGPDFVFTSETYGNQLAALLGARHVCVDLNRSTFPVSGSAVRDNPRAHWEMLPPAVQKYYQELSSTTV